ncbi:hypothetical protein PGT21_007000 [Puccinia graminis f. sp. tritici]|uniref:Uncharacterized protein n=1 Tax=Puccinia graminis f. sp. tritici TaxID=56615 RepID=A0A5B0QI46_PUCGR|nr:hypothetical protein PGT21_007000 [Puccinia graminis f. sp. tritici]
MKSKKLVSGLRRRWQIFSGGQTGQLVLYFSLVDRVKACLPLGRVERLRGQCVRLGRQNVRIDYGDPSSGGMIEILGARVVV